MELEPACVDNKIYKLNLLDLKYCVYTVILSDSVSKTHSDTCSVDPFKYGKTRKLWPATFKGLLTWK